MNRRKEKWLDAYRDGELSAEQRARAERELRDREESAERVRHTDLLGRAIRESWTEGPPAPAPEFLIQAIRPAIREIDAEIEARSSIWQLSMRLGDWLRPAPVAALAATVLIAVALTLPQSESTSPSPVVAASLAPVTADLPWAAPPEAVYDLAQEGAPLMVFEGVDGSTIFWILDENGTSLSWPSSDGWA